MRAGTAAYRWQGTASHSGPPHPPTDQVLSHFRLSFCGVKAAVWAGQGPLPTSSQPAPELSDKPDQVHSLSGCRPNTHLDPHLFVLPAPIPPPPRARLSGATSREPNTASAFSQRQPTLRASQVRMTRGTGPRASWDPPSTPVRLCSHLQQGNQGSASVTRLGPPSEFLLTPQPTGGPHSWGRPGSGGGRFALLLPCISRAREPSGSLGETLPQQGSCGCQRGGRARTSSDVSPGLSVTHLAPHTLRASQQQDEWNQRMGSFVFPNEFPPPFRGAESFIFCFAGTLQLGEGRGLVSNINLM